MSQSLLDHEYKGLDAGGNARDGAEGGSSDEQEPLSLSFEAQRRVKHVFEHSKDWREISARHMDRDYRHRTLQQFPLFYRPAQILLFTHPSPWPSRLIFAALGVCFWAYGFGYPHSVFALTVDIGRWSIDLFCCLDGLLCLLMPWVVYRAINDPVLSALFEIAQADCRKHTHTLVWRWAMLTVLWSCIFQFMLTFNLVKKYHTLDPTPAAISVVFCAAAFPFHIALAYAICAWILMTRLLASAVCIAGQRFEHILSVELDGVAIVDARVPSGLAAIAAGAPSGALHGEQLAGKSVAYASASAASAAAAAHPGLGASSVKPAPPLAGVEGDKQAAPSAAASGAPAAAAASVAIPIAAPASLAPPASLPLARTPVFSPSMPLFHSEDGFLSERTISSGTAGGDFTLPGGGLPMTAGFAAAAIAADGGTGTVAGILAERMLASRLAESAASACACSVHVDTAIHMHATVTRMIEAVTYMFAPLLMFKIVSDGTLLLVGVARSIDGSNGENALFATLLLIMVSVVVAVLILTPAAMLTGEYQGIISKAAELRPRVQTAAQRVLVESLMIYLQPYSSSGGVRIAGVLINPDVAVRSCVIMYTLFAAAQLRI